ncbi:MAG TPA: hypothetical protein VEI97_07060, partial [bacterium]|nr:hypothetical protein [bacterium]
YGADALSIMVAPTATLTEGEINLPAGFEYILDKDGAMIRSTAFPSMNLSNTLGTELPGTFVEGRAFIEFNSVFPVLTIEENRYGLRTLTLARNKWQDTRPGGGLHLYDGFKLTFREDASLDSQEAFQEIAINGALTKPQDPATTPRVFSGPGAPGYGLPGMGATQEANVCLNEMGIRVYCDTGLPVGRGPGESGTPQIDAPKAYTHPALKVIGIIPFTYEGKLGTEGGRPGNPDNYVRMLTENLQAQLAEIEGLEVKVLELEPSDQTGAYVLDFAKRIGQKYGCDAILHGKITTLETVSDNTVRLTGEVRLNGEVAATLVDTTGGRYNWKNSDKVRKFVSADQFERGSGPAIRDLLNTVAEHLVGDMAAQEMFKEREVK